MKINKLTLVLAFVMTTLLSFGQDARRITGVVLDEFGEPVIGATVIVPGTQIGAITDIDGSYVIEVPAGIEELQVSYLTLEEPQIVEITGDQVDVQLGSSDFVIDEVVVTGYSTQEKSKFSGSSTQVSSQIIDDKNTSDISEALAGEVTGLQVINGNGQPGTPAQIRIRGFGSVNGNRSPLYVVDGAIYNGPVESLNPADIASTNVLKDAVATALYGNRGANGVIVITTKKGKAGKSSISFNGSQGSNFRALPYYNTIQSPEEYVEISWEGLENAYGAQTASESLFGNGVGVSDYYNIWDTEGQYLIDPATGKFRDGVTRKFTPASRRDVFFNPSNRSEGTLQIGGGEGNTTYMTSFGYLNDKGYFLESEFERYTGRLNIQHQAKEWLRGSMNLGYANTSSDYPGQSEYSSTNGFYLERNAPTMYDIYLRDENGNRVEDQIFGGSLYDFGDGGFNGNSRRFSSLSNIAAVNNYDIARGKSGNLNGTAEVVATFLKNFDFTTRVSYQTEENKYNNLGNKYYGQSSGSGGSLSKEVANNNTLSFLKQLTYGNDIGEHSFNIHALHENTAYNYDFTYASATGAIADPFGLELDNYLTKNPAQSYGEDEKLESYLVFGDYNYKGKYFLNASVRRDGTSRFSEENRWGTFPAVGVSWLASEEDFVANSNWLDFLKIRASIGQTGSQGGIGFYRGGGNLFNLSNISGVIPALPERAVVDPDLTWETVTQADLGIEFTVLERIDAVFDFYSKTTSDLFFDRRVGPSAGYALTTVNDGELLNRGFEFDVQTNLVNTDDFSLVFGFNGSTLHNELTVGPIDNATGKTKPISDEGLFARAEGKSIFDYYIPEFVGVNPENGWSQWTMFYNDVDNDGVFTANTDEAITDLVDYKAKNPQAKINKTTTEEYASATQFFTGQSAIPDLNGATRLSMEWKGLRFTSQFLYGIGGYGYDGNYAALLDNDVWGGNNFHADIRNRWQNPGDVTTIPKLTNGEGAKAGTQNNTSTAFLTKKDYLTLNNIKLSYKLPKSIIGKLGVQDVNVWASGDNLWARTEREGFFPFASEAGVTNREAYDPLSTGTIGLNFKF